jgi:hypothetical protein
LNRSLQAYLRHKNVEHTVRYTELSPERLKDLFRVVHGTIPRLASDEALKIWTVDKIVGNVRNNGFQLILPVLTNVLPA